MFAKGFYVTVELRAKSSERSDELAAALLRLRDESLKEEGCTVFVVHRDLADPSRFLLWERFADEAALKIHATLPHTAAFGALQLADAVQVYKTDILP